MGNIFNSGSAYIEVYALFIKKTEKPGKES